MDSEEAKQFVACAYEIAFRRPPNENELTLYSTKLESGRVTPTQFLRTCIAANEFQVRNAVRSIFPMGHYHSPVVDPANVGAYLKREAALTIKNVHGVKLDLPAMRALWRRH